jgi:phosphoglucosamine mutase
MKLFGTDGLRGNAGEFPLDPSSVRRVGREVGASLDARRAVVLGGDTRQSTPALMEELSDGLELAGAKVACAGVIPTPGVAELVLALGAGAGISVSASHNPFEDNGIKIFGADGRKWPDEREEAVERVLLAERGKGEDRRADGTKGPRPDGSLAGIYLARLREHVPAKLDGLPVLVDAGNGAAYRLAPEALRGAGARVHAVFDRPDGRNINAGCGALHPGGMAEATRTAGACLGVALDGDADRSIFSDENGRILDGDDVLWIIAREWKRTGRLKHGGVVGTVMSNFGLEAALGREGIAFRRAAVGDRNVARLMEETGASIGGETSGHVLLPFSPAGDGIQTTLLLASIVASSGTPLSRLATLEKTPQILRNVRVARRVAYEEIPSIAEAMARARARFDGRGRIFLRYSGTEPLLRILVEGPEESEVRAVADELESTVRAGLAE